MTVSGLFLRTTTAGLLFRKLESNMEEREASTKSLARTVRLTAEGTPGSITRRTKT